MSRRSTHGPDAREPSLREILQFLECIPCWQNDRPLAHTRAEALVVWRAGRDGAALPDERELGLAGGAEAQHHPHAPPLHRDQRRRRCQESQEGKSMALARMRLATDVKSVGNTWYLGAGPSALLDVDESD